MFKVGITGGIGSGKTTAANVFKTLGVPIYNADIRAKELMSENPELKQELKVLFGDKAFTSEGILNKKYIAEKVFYDQEILSKLNSLVHPYVFSDAADWFASIQGHDYALKEAALMVETGSYKKLDFLILVTANEDVRIKRVMERDKLSSPEEVLSRIKNQLSDETRIEKADFIIHNDGSKSLVKQVHRIDRLLRKISGR